MFYNTISFLAVASFVVIVAGFWIFSAQKNKLPASLNQIANKESLYYKYLKGIFNEPKNNSDYNLMDMLLHFNEKIKKLKPKQKLLLKTYLDAIIKSNEHFKNYLTIMSLLMTSALLFFNILFNYVYEIKQKENIIIVISGSILALLIIMFLRLNNDIRINRQYQMIYSLLEENINNKLHNRRRKFNKTNC